MQRPDGCQLQLVLLAPAAELRHGLHVGRASVLVADGGGEEFEEVLAGFVAGSGDEGGHGKSPGAGGQERGGYEISGHGCALLYFRGWMVSSGIGKSFLLSVMSVRPYCSAVAAIIVSVKVSVMPLRAHS